MNQISMVIFGILYVVALVVMYAMGYHDGRHGR